MIISRDTIADVCNELRVTNRQIVFTNGCFDILHAGHVTYLEKAKRLGDILIIGLNSDKSVKRLKGESRPVNSEHDRAIVLGALKAVDFVVYFEEDTPLELIKIIKPDFLVKGGDYKIENIVGADIVQDKGGEVIVIPFVEGKSTTNIINKMRG
ncbi:MAG: D-glycero-beta-D-manno-heptose 1-phosphate adenylyltransferase [Bacteroidota bacterium]